MRRKLGVLVFLAVVLMMYLYPLSIVPLLLLAREWEEFREEWRKSTLFIGLSLPLYGAKVVLGLSGWTKTLGITPVQAGPAVEWAVLLAFTALQTVAVYYVYRVAAGLRLPYTRTGGMIMVIAVPLHLISIMVYFILTWTGLILFLLGLESGKEVIG
ncbi:transposase [Thermococcus sp.]|uniref:transposase n=1 Tax=Thermococcus sp. TaxID=35749 RepID=UPI002612F7B1|nr:transposase [Thermococcus sp.]